MALAVAEKGHQKKSTRCNIQLFSSNWWLLENSSGGFELSDISGMVLGGPSFSGDNCTTLKAKR
jgi:hypothetical protein